MNVVALTGRVLSISIRDLPSGCITDLEVGTLEGTVPVKSEVDHPPIQVGDLIAVRGVVRRTWFRSGGVTHARTEVIADKIHKEPA